MRTRRTVALLAALCGAARVARAQTGPGTVRGVVYDSIVGAPLAGAEVWLEGHTRTAVTDAAGTFRIDSVPAGSYTVTFGHASLDSLGLGAPFGRVDVAAGRAIDVRLTTPSMRGIAARLCPGQSLDSAGVLLGAVREAASGAPLANARVEIAWQEWQVLDKRIDRRSRALVATTGATGRYVVCGAPNDVLVELHGRVLTWHDLTLGVRATTTGQPRADAATLALTVIDSAGRPVAEAQARVGADTAYRVSSSDGRLRVGNLAPGSQAVDVRAIEVYPGNNGIPPQYGIRGCGAVIVWTRLGA